MGHITPNQHSVLRYIVGYVLGVAIFMVFIPYAIWYLSSLDYLIFRIPVVPSDRVAVIIATPVFITGVIYVVWSNLFLLLRGKGGPTDIAGLSISPRTRRLVQEGPYRHTRNPMVFGTHSIYLSITLYLNSLGGVIIVALFFFTLVKYVLTEEEKRLLRDFGEEYQRYRANTSMIIPLPGGKTKKG